MAYNKSDWAVSISEPAESSEAVKNGSEGSGKDGSNGAGPGAMYKAVSQLVLLYGRKSWVVNREMFKVLEGFHHRAAQRITGMPEK